MDGVLLAGVTVTVRCPLTDFIDRPKPPPTPRPPAGVADAARARGRHTPQ
ncbi:hypothetical protein [Streptomyces sp. NPDC003483]